MNTERIWYLLDRLKIHHILFWMAYYAFWIQAYRAAYKNINDLYIVTAVYLVFNAANYYTITYWVTPRFYNRRQYGRFFIWLVIIIVLASAGLALSLIGTMKLVGIDYQFAFSALFLYVLMSNITILGAATALKQLMARFRADRVEKVAREKHVEAELQYLKAQVNPHFLFNAINSVYFLIKKDPDKASETLIKLSDLLRFQLYDCSDETIPIEKELEYIGNYIALEKLRKGERVTVEYTQEGNLSGFPIAPFMLIPFLENAFKFISNYTDRQNLIRITLRRGETFFQATFFNMYENLPRNEVGGIGLKNVTRRLELLYPDYTLNVHDENETYSVTLTIPLT